MILRFIGDTTWNFTYYKLYPYNMYYTNEYTIFDDTGNTLIVNLIDYPEYWELVEDEYTS